MAKVTSGTREIAVSDESMARGKRREHEIGEHKFHATKGVLPSPPPLQLRCFSIRHQRRNRQLHHITLPLLRRSHPIRPSSSNGRRRNSRYLRRPTSRLTHIIQKRRQLLRLSIVNTRSIHLRHRIKPRRRLSQIHNRRSTRVTLTHNTRRRTRRRVIIIEERIKVEFAAVGICQRGICIFAKRKRRCACDAIALRSTCACTRSR
ncbi:hypothetical protein K474DRAFT_1121245 [Panus rudis PR-1116 ss-1]|nr:hypothetical protein K474DRAFT_1121245 [Panus rudis PR-1116 ss-1]